MSPGGGLFRDAREALLGVPRVLGRTLGAATTDLASGAAELVETTGERLTGRRRDLSSLRVAVVVLSDEQGRPVTSVERVQASLDRADAVLRAEAGIAVRVTGVTVDPDPAPTDALDPPANRRLLLADVLGRTETYRRHTDPPGPGGGATSLGAPVTVVVVRDISGRTTGCSLGMTADWVIVQAALFDPERAHTYDETVLAHELGHALNLPHHRDRHNLMFPASSPPGDLRGTDLTPWQGAVLRANRHVLPGVPLHP
ncbi:hypothetical protein FDO65_03735 [Nakamurella flava]|uniref:Matrixin family metalloprotease n=1 Tax=Nakamurella flava TaxID=2576308 RepID=A0A4U6QK18_9ACTN|nr:hypothetical protein [Nakamurella flava]TKV60793.1 hypothetical protein FDO65_03735 [Nakamurella flava]